MTITNSNKVMIKHVHLCTVSDCINWYSYFGNHIARGINGPKVVSIFDPVIIPSHIYSKKVIAETILCLA